MISRQTRRSKMNDTRRPSVKYSLVSCDVRCKEAAMPLRSHRSTPTRSNHVLSLRSKRRAQSFEPLVMRCRIAASGDVRQCCRLAGLARPRRAPTMTVNDDQANLMPDQEARSRLDRCGRIGRS